jgi:L,D-peptidoglycan transpeptidase YkuD (ErfK/YbiS/YcfS/YnhG family)
MRKLPIALLLLAGCSSGPTTGPDGVGVVPAGCKQVIVVRKSADNPNGPIMLTAYESSGGWKAVQGPISCTIGRDGFAAADQKKEGDGKTPTGVYRIGMAFGAPKQVDTKLDYKNPGPDDFWCDDPNSQQYNRMTKGMPSDAKSFEKLTQDAYKYAAVIEYNTDTVVPGAGSAIFLHVWGGPDKPTAGCVAVAEPEMVKLLAWLDKSKKPAIAINP